MEEEVLETVPYMGYIGMLCYHGYGFKTINLVSSIEFRGVKFCLAQGNIYF